VGTVSVHKTTLREASYGELNPPIGLITSFGRCGKPLQRRTNDFNVVGVEK
jgi:hypothetical protein